MDLLSSLGIAPQHAEDVVNVAVCPDDPCQDLQALRVECTQLLLPLMQGYIWQKEPLRFHTSDADIPPWCSEKPGRSKKNSYVATSSSTHPDPYFRAHHPPCVWATLSFGDNIEDEWFVVFLVRTLTQRLSVPTCARVWDNDGEFLLIEAAYSLPKWVKPETSENRLWWRKGELVLIPPPGPKCPLSSVLLSVHEALELVRHGVNALQVEKVQKAVDNRLSSYSPSCTTRHMHRARCILPLRVAHILRHEPQLVAAAVEAFYYRDPAATRTARHMAHFPPENMVPCTVLMNRCMYAQLKQQQFHAHKGYPMPPASSSNFGAADLGLKILYGMEVVYHEARGHEPKRAAERVGQPGAVEVLPAMEAALPSNPAWVSYISALEGSGYFQGNIPGSQVYTELLGRASESFVQSELYERTTERLAAPAVRMDEILQESIKPEEFGPDNLSEADSDTWMAEEGSRLEEELSMREAEWEVYTSKKAHKGPRGPPASHPTSGSSGPPLDAASLANVMHKFVEHMSGLEGVEVPQDRDGVNLSTTFLWDELCSALGVSHLGPPSGSKVGSRESKRVDSAVSGGDRLINGQPEAGQEEESDDEGAMSSGSYTTTEGSSFFEGSVESGAEHDGSEQESGDDSEGEDECEDDRSEGDRSKEEKGRESRETAGRTSAGSSRGAAGKSNVPELRSNAHGVKSMEPSAQSMVEDDGSRQADWEVHTATDSDDHMSDVDVCEQSVYDMNAGFDEAYDQAMDAELAGTTIAQSFETVGRGQGLEPAAGPLVSRGVQGTRAGAGPFGSGAGGGASGLGLGAGTSESKGESQVSADFPRVDVDMNLVKSLLRSHSEQHGLPGPASGLLGLLGVELPQDRGEQERK